MSCLCSLAIDIAPHGLQRISNCFPHENHTIYIFLQSKHFDLPGTFAVAGVRDFWRAVSKHSKVHRAAEAPRTDLHRFFRNGSFQKLPKEFGQYEVVEGLGVTKVLKTEIITRVFW
jgi:hypothetical protein